MTLEIQYRAFIIHSHADASWAKWLHRWLEGFRADNQLIGRDAAGTIHKTLRFILRESDEFSADHALSYQTLAALDVSYALIVIGSPSCSKSPYVSEVIRIFKSRHPERLVIPLLVDGGAAAAECFPPLLKFKLDAEGKVTNEPIELSAIDVREEGDGKYLALAKIVGRLLDVSPEEVFQRSERGFRGAKREAQRRAITQGATKISSRAVIAVAIFTLITLAGVFTFSEYQKRRQIADMRSLAEKYGEIDRARISRLRDGPSVTEAISSIAQVATWEPRYATALELLKAGKYREAEPLLKTVAEDAKLSGKNNKEAAEAFRNLASIAAISDHGKARGYYAEAAILDPDHVEGMFWHGWFEAEAGSLREAETAYRQVLGAAKSREDDWPVYLSRLGIGDIRISRGDFSAAIAEYQVASEMADGFASADPGSQSDLPVAYSKTGDGLMAEGNLAEALTSYRKGITIIERLVEAEPDNLSWQHDLVAAYGRKGEALARQGEVTLALDAFSHGRRIATRLKEQLSDDRQLPNHLAALDLEIAKLEQAKALKLEIVQSQHE